MRRPVFRSFRTRLFAAFLAVSLISLLIGSALLLQIFRLRLAGHAEEEAGEYLSGLSEIMDEAYGRIVRAAATLRDSPLAAQALAGDGGDSTQVNRILFNATEDCRAYARFDLYDSAGGWRYSTRGAPVRRQLPLHWGVLQAARGEELTFVACGDAADMDAPLLQGAVPLSGRAGYLVVSIDYSGFRQLYEGKYGAQNDLILLSRYWRPVYCAQPSLAETLAPELRRRLLAGEELDGISEDFSYWTAYHAPTGLYLVLRQPQVFTRDTTRLLYTAGLACALICVAVSVLMSLKVSRQMSRPIQQLHRGLRDVADNNLDVYVPPPRDDELGELAEGFNGMVSALKRNQEELIQNQQELNQAQIRMLQAQLNPHFLCNTLDTMKWISKINKVPQVALMSTNLADILRFCISPDEFVSLEREVGILRRYLEIQKIRLSSAFAFSVDLPAQLEDCLVPKMILQPIVENSILHGLRGVEDGRIQVRACEVEGALLRLTVTDNGQGLPPDMVGAYYYRDRERRQGRLGLYNVDTILTKYYGEDCGLYLDNGPGGRGAVVTATLPIRREEEPEC